MTVWNMSFQKTKLGNYLMSVFVVKSRSDVGLKEDSDTWNKDRGLYEEYLVKGNGFS